MASFFALLFTCTSLSFSSGRLDEALLQPCLLAPRTPSQTRAGEKQQKKRQKKPRKKQRGHLSLGEGNLPGECHNLSPLSDPATDPRRGRRHIASSFIRFQSPLRLWEEQARGGKGEGEEEEARGAEKKREKKTLQVNEQELRSMRRRAWIHSRG